MKTATSVSSLSSQANSPATPNSGIHPQARLSLNENVETLRRWPDEKNKNIYHTFKEEPPGVCFFFFFLIMEMCVQIFSSCMCGKRFLQVSPDVPTGGYPAICTPPDGRL